MSSTLVTVAAYATARRLSERQVQRYVRDGRIPGVVEVDGVRLIPADAAPTPVRAELVPATSPTSPSSPPAMLGELGTLEDAAALLGTSPHMVRVMADDPITPFVVRPWGPAGALRVYVVPR
jgi:hypothetical protein